LKPNAQNIKKRAYYPNHCTDSNRILHGDKRPPNTLRGWSKQAYNKCKMADGRHVEKSKNDYISTMV